MVYNMVSQRVKKLAQIGAHFADLPATLCRGVPVVIPMLLDYPKAFEVLTGQRGLCKAEQRDLLLINSSTKSPRFGSERATIAKESKIRLLEAPVIGVQLMTLFNFLLAVTNLILRRLEQSWKLRELRFSLSDLIMQRIPPNLSTTC